jgi:hypothetical protein
MPPNKNSGDTQQGDLISLLTEIRGTHRQQGDLISLVTRMKGIKQTGAQTDSKVIS